MPIRFVLSLPVIFFLLSCTDSNLPEKVAISYSPGIPQVDFSINELHKALTDKKILCVEDLEESSSGMSLKLSIDISLGYESYLINQEGNTIKITGGDGNGLMYAVLELTDMIRLEKKLTELGLLKASPYIKKRGLRFNIPLDARTPSYDDTGDAAQKNIETVWDFEFWKKYLDMMARNRYNLLTFWNLHPYPSWVKVPEYPDVALDDVCVYTGKIDANTDMKWRGLGIQNPDSLKVIKKITVDEKIAFWNKVFQYAEDRGIEIYIFHWNVFVNGAEGKHGIEWRQDSPITVDYIRKSVKQFLLTYPNIKGIGITAGEHINRELTGKYKTENWMWLTYGQGVMDAMAEKPGLDVRFIFRRHWSDLDDILEAFKDYDGTFETSFKYSRARMYSSTKPPWFDKIYRSTVEKYNIKCWLNVRNDDIFTFRWGDPEYAQAYIKNLPYDLIPGFYMGPDGYVWGYEFISKNPRVPIELEVEKHWYRFMIWGRTSYDPNLPESFFIDQIGLHFPEVDAKSLYTTWKATSEIISWIDKIHFRQNDFQFSPEGCFDRVKFHDINDFIHIGCMPEQGVISISDYASSNGKDEGISPFEVADKLDQAAEILLEGAAKINPGSNLELKETLGDFMALAHLGRYYARKVRGATYTALFRYTGNEENKIKAISILGEAVEEWKSYADVAFSLYHPQLYARTQMLNWNAILPEVEKDVEIARNAEKGQSIEVTDDNILWKEDQTRL